MLLEIIIMILVPTAAIYIIWFAFVAATYQPLTPDELNLQWEVHKQRTGCNAERIQRIIKRKKENVGFKCECGYEYYQKRLITQRAPKQKMEAKQCS